jgi:mono/diheme cytochrome c family protein
MKICWPLVAVLLAVFAGVRPGNAAAQSGPPVRDIGSEARNVFANKCAVCHGPDLAKPKGRFGYVLDLKRIAANPEMVIPLHPDESELWVLVNHDEMPPSDSPQGALLQKQKEVIHDWIAAGAPEPFTVSSGSPPSVQLESTASATLSTADRMLRWVAKFHLLMIHFPIALILAAGIGEVRSLTAMAMCMPTPTMFWAGRSAIRSRPSGPGSTAQCVALRPRMTAKAMRTCLRATTPRPVEM